jgi:TonB family protein
MVEKAWPKAGLGNTREKMNTHRNVRLLIVLLPCVWFLFFSPFSTLVAQQAQQIDPFYRALLEKAQKSFLAKNYEQAARDFEIASFGFMGDKALRAKAYVYISISCYYLKDMKSCEKYLRDAADLIGEEGMQALEVFEEARPDLDKLMTFFNIRRAQPAQPTDARLPQKLEQQEKPSEQAPANEAPPQSSPGQEKPISANSSPPIKPEEKPPQEPAQQDAGKNLSQITLDNLKEGDLLSLDMVETQPTVLKRVPADYPSAARSFRIEGTVMMKALISEKGDVIKTEIINGITGAFGFNQSAQRAVRQWKFEPATIKGIKVKVWITVAIVFKFQEPT